MGVCRVNGARLYFQTAGEGDALVLLHGLGSSSQDWESQVPEFSRKYRVIAPDFRGFGGSSRKGPYGVEPFARDVWALLDRQRIDRFHLLGYSMGGAVAMQMTLERPQRVRGLILSNCLPSFHADSLAKRMLLGYRLLMMSLLGPRRLADGVARKLYPRADQAELRARVAKRNASNDRASYLETIRALVGWSVRERLSELDRPVLLLAAEHDYFPRADVLAFASALRQARLEVIPGARHGMPLDSPEPFNRAVLDYLATVR